MAELELTPAWDKTFEKSDKVGHAKATFRTRYGIALAAGVYKPADAPADARLAAIAVCGPFGAVKEQASGLFIPDAVHTDLYDGGGKDAIPFDKTVDFIDVALR